MSAHRNSERHVTQEQIESARRVDLEQLVSRAGVKLIRRGRYVVACCPFHKDKTPSFKVENNRYHCFGCSADGDAISWVCETERLNFADAVLRLNGADVERVKPFLQVVARTEKPAAALDSPKVQKARAIWQSALPAQGTDLRRYFEARQLPWPPPPTIRFCPDFIWTRAGMMTLPAMIVAVQAPVGQVIAIEATALAADCSRKAFAGSRHKEGELAAGAVRLAPAGRVLGLAEGAETGLSAQKLTGVPVWCCLGAARMQQVAIPPEVVELHIFADDDEAGRSAADRAAAMHRHLKRIIRLPPQGCKDWNDVLLGRRDGEMLQTPDFAA